MSETSPIEPATPELISPKAIELVDRTMIAVGGKDACSFLHNLVTANIERLRQGEGTLAALLTPQGKIIADMLIHNASDDEPLFLIDIARGFAEDVLARLTRYRLRAAVTLDLVGEPNAVLVVLNSPPISGEAFYTFLDPRHPALGQRLYGPRDAIRDAISAFEMATPDTYHLIRVRLGICEGGKDFIGVNVFPHEANFDRIGGIDFKKGCYVGQEVVSRMEHRGTTRTRAVPVRFSNGFGVVGGADVKIGERVIGRIGECFHDSAIAIVRFDHLEKAILTKDTIIAGGVPIECNLLYFQEFHDPKA